MNKNFQKVFAAIVFSVALFSINVQAQTTWSTFWTKFKTAVVKNDKLTVMELSRDDMSNENYKELFGTKARQNCFAKAKPIKDGNNYVVFCGEQGYMFEKVMGKYRFTEGFAND